MLRRSVRSAGDDVAAVVAQLSDDLLVEEERAFAEIEAVYTTIWSGTVVEVVEQVKADDLAGELRRSPFPGQMAAAAQLAIDRSSVPVAALLDRAIELVMPSTRLELEICESAMPRRCRGVAAEGMEEGEAARKLIYDQAFADWRRGADVALTAFQTEMSAQLGYAILYGDSRDALIARMTSPSPNRLQGNNGRGVWWRPMTTVKRIAREAEIGMTNDLRMACIDGCNRAARLR